VSSVYGRNTEDIASGNWVYSPRVGFNWDVTGDSRNQLRGGWGYFTGRPGFVWMSNAFQNSGMIGFQQLTCTSTATAPRFTVAAIKNPPLACATGATPAPLSTTGEIDLIGPDVKFPTSSRASLGYDRALGDGWVLTLEGMYTKALNGWYYSNLALTGLQGYDRHGRAMYGTQPASAVLKGARQLVLEVSNQDRDYSYQLTGGLTRKFRNNFEASVFYNYSQARSIQDLTSSTAGSQYRFGQPRSYTPQENPADQKLGHSVFEQPHKISAMGSYTFPKSGTTVTLTYRGESGQAFHYQYNNGASFNDLNADGQGNDLMYIPSSVTDSNEVIFVATSTATVAQQQEAFQTFIDSHSCLKSQKGTIMERGSCREPFHHMINFTMRQSLGRLRLAQALNAPALNNLSLQWDIFNLANLINRKWGAQDFTGFGSVDAPLVYNSKESGSMIGPSGARPKFTFNPAYKFTSRQNFTSLYQMQFSVRYSF
jgi:hypothetical protein